MRRAASLFGVLQSLRLEYVLRCAAAQAQAHQHQLDQQIQLRRSSHVANAEQPQRRDPDLDGLLVSLLAIVEQDLGAVDPRFVELRPRVRDQGLEQLIGALEVRRQILALQGF